MVAGGANFADPGDDWGSEGVFQNYSFYKGNKYYLQAYVRAYTTNRADDDIDKVFIALTDGLTPKGRKSDGTDASYRFPSVTEKQEIWNEQNYYTGSNWVSVEKEFIPDNDYAQLWISLTDNEDSEFGGSSANLEFTLVNVSCCPFDQIVSSSNNLSTLPTAMNNIETTGSVTVSSGQNIKFEAGNEVILKPGFIAGNGSSFTASIGNCDCSLGGGNIVNICNVFDGPINFSTSQGGTGVYVPNVLVRNGSNYWYPTSYGYSKPYNAYHWKLEVFNRWGKKVDELEETSGVDGFVNQSIKWNAKGLSAGVYNILLKLTNCTGTYTFKDWVQVSDASARLAANKEKNRLQLDDERINTTNAVTSTTLLGAFPNPSHSTTSIAYEIAQAGYVNLKLLDATGNEIFILVDDKKHKVGYFTVDVNTDKLPPGVYFYKLQTSSYSGVEKLIIQ